MKTGCEHYGEALVELARGELEAWRGEEVEAHLASCRDCREALAVIRAVGAEEITVPEGLEARLKAGVREWADDRAPAGGVATVRPVPARRRSRARRLRWPEMQGRRVWALPAAAAAALALWLGGRAVLGPDGAAPAPDAVVAEYGELEPYGTLPGEGGVVAGDVVLSELSVEELEALLEELES